MEAKTGSLGWQDGPVGKSACHSSLTIFIHSLGPLVGKELSLASACLHWHVHMSACTHARTHMQSIHTIIFKGPMSDLQGTKAFLGLTTWLAEILHG